MRLLVITQYFWPENFRINDLVSELVERGHEIVVLTGKPNYPQGQFFPDFLRDPGQFAAYKGARILRAPMLPRGRGGFSLIANYASFAIGAAIYGLYALRKEHFDAILVYEPSPVTVGVPAIVLRRLMGWPVAFWVQDQWPETLVAVGAVKSQAILRGIGKLVSYIYKRCDLILSQSKSLLSQIGKYTQHDKRIEYFPNWAESIFYHRIAEAAIEVPLAENSFDIVFAGNIGEAQDFPAILEAAEILAEDRRIRWIILGDGRLAAWVREQVSQRQLERSVILLGRFPLERMMSFYEHADALLVTLKSDPVFSMTLPGKVQSYLAAGKPVLGMLDGEGASIIIEAKAGLVCAAGNARALADAALRMSKLSFDELQRMGGRGREFSDREFDRNTLLTKLEKWLSELSKRKVRSDGVKQ